MSVEVEEEVIALPKALEQARAGAAEGNLPYAGGVAPQKAWELVQSGQAVLVDVRSGEERKFVGHVPGSQHVAWATGTALTRNPRFVRELEAKLAKAGFTNVFNVLEGFEGEIDAQLHRGGSDGWRFHKLPWVQD
jgi:rhodanese-related sulfurtransferase